MTTNNTSNTTNSAAGTLKTVQARQKAKANTDKLAARKAVSDLPKNNASVFSMRPEPNRGPGDDRHPNVARAKLTRPSRQFGEEVSVGSGAVAGITDPTTNYAFQDAKKKKLLKQVKSDMVRRKKPVGEEFSAGIGNTQAPANSKKIDKKSLKAIRGGKKAAISPSKTSNSVDVAPPIGGG